MKVEVTFTEGVLGTLAANKEIATEFIASKHPDFPEADEIAAIENMDEAMERGTTVFPREDGKPFVWDYQVKGVLKEACLAMIETDTITKEDLKKVRLTPYLFKRTIDKQIFPGPRKIFLQLPDGTPEKLPFCERPLRGQTMRGERISLARSEEAPAGTKIEFEIVSRNAKLWDYIKTWLDYGKYSGFLQWRNSGKGRYTWRELKE